MADTLHPRSRGDCTAYTLLEIVLVLSVLTVIFAMSWPMLSGTWDNLRLRKAADQVRTAWGKARLTAIKNGQIQAFRFQPDGDQYRTETWEGASASPESAQAGTKTSTSDASKARVLHLPSGVTFVHTQPQDGRGAESNGWSAPVVFYQDGTASDTRLTLQGNDMRRLSIWLRGLTGAIRTGDIVKEDTSQEDTVKEDTADTDSILP